MAWIPDLELLPEGLPAAIELDLGAEIVEVRTHAGVGVSREGCFLKLSRDGAETEGYLAYDVRRADDPARKDFCRREASALGHVAARGIRAPLPLGRWPEFRAILTRVMPGDVAMDGLSEATQIVLARDYMGEIARLHRLDVTGLELDGFGPPPANASDYARARLDGLRQRHTSFGKDEPLNLLLYRWLDRHMPQGELSPRFVHGDIGPANFLHDGQRVTAVLDWESTHFGDPMEDMAWLVHRLALFPSLPAAPMIAAWEEELGEPVDMARIAFYRVLVATIVLTDMAEHLVQSDSEMRGNPGQVFSYYLAIRRLVLIALAEAEGIALEPVAVPEGVEGWPRLAAITMADIASRIAPRLPDKASRARADYLPRLIQYWQGRNRLGAQFDLAERDAIAEALEQPFASIDEARAELGRAIVDERLSIAQAIRLSHLRAAADIHCAGDGIGHLAYLNYPDIRAGEFA